MTQDTSTVDNPAQTDSSTEYTHSRLGPDMTIPGTLFGVLVGVGIATVYPEQAKAVLTLGVGGGWMLGFAATLIAE